MQTEYSFLGYANINIRYHYNNRRLHTDRCKTNRLIENTQCILSTFNTDIRLWIVWLIAFLPKGLDMRLKWIKEAIHQKKTPIKWRRNLNSRTHKNVLETTLSLTKNFDLQYLSLSTTWVSLLANSQHFITKNQTKTKKQKNKCPYCDL